MKANWGVNAGKRTTNTHHNHHHHTLHYHTLQHYHHNHHLHNGTFPSFFSAKSKITQNKLATHFTTQSNLFSSSASSSPYSKVEEEDVRYFESIMEKKQIIREEDSLEEYNRDWTKRYKGRSKLALLPSNTSQLSSILSYCNSRKLAVVGQGGNTGLVGGGIPINDEIILSTKLLNSIDHFDDKSGIVQCGSGVILQSLNDYLSPYGFITPLDLGAKGSCTIGGNIATNAGGIRYLRYGSLHANVIGLEVVLADGRVIDNKTTMKKDNTGYDVKQLFIGSEGSLGIISSISLRCPVKPIAVQVIFIACYSYADVIKIYSLACHHLSDILSAYEMIDEMAMDLTIKHISGTRFPFNRKYPFYVLIETSGSNLSHDQLKAEEFFDKVEKEVGEIEGVISSDTKQMNELWKLRETITEALTKSSPAVYKYDLSLPYDHYYQIVDEARSILPSDLFKVYAYGHVGDGNLHLNITGPDYSKETAKYIEPWVYLYTQKSRGSVSAEHGIGQLKLNYLPFSKSKNCIDLMRTLKLALDPNLILNPYKVIPFN